MSLDVYLEMKNDDPAGSGIFVREDGQIKEISRTEWDEKFPGREPVIIPDRDENETVFWANITHNLAGMAREASIYNCLWRPDRFLIERAEQLIEPLERGLHKLKSNPGRFKKFDASNGWGTYDQFVPWVERYLAACQKYPEAQVRVSR